MEWLTVVVGVVAFIVGANVGLVMAGLCQVAKENEIKQHAPAPEQDGQDTAEAVVRYLNGGKS